MSIRMLAVGLIVVGALILAFPALGITTRETVVQVGPLEVTADRERQLPIPQILGGIVAALGVGLLVMKRKS